MNVLICLVTEQANTVRLVSHMLTAIFCVLKSIHDGILEDLFYCSIVKINIFGSRIANIRSLTVRQLDLCPLETGPTQE